MGNVSVIEKPEPFPVLAEDSPKDQESVKKKDKVEEQAEQLHSFMHDMQKLAKLSLMATKDKTGECTDKHTKLSLSANIIDLSESDRQKVLENSLWQYGTLQSSWEPAKTPLFKTDAAFTDNLFTRSCPAEFTCKWGSSEEDIKMFQSGYNGTHVEGHDRLSGSHTQGNLEESHQGTRNSNKKKQYLYVEQLIPKGGLDLNMIFDRKNTTDEFKNFFSLSEAITFEKVQTFYETFGDIFPTRVLFGGKRYLSRFVSDEERTKETQTHLEGKILNDLVISPDLKAEVSAEGNQTVKESSRQSQSTNQANISTQGGSPEDSETKDKWLRSVAENPTTWTIIKVEQFEPIIDLLDEKIRARVQKCFDLQNGKNFVQLQHQKLSHFPWKFQVVKWARNFPIKAKKFEGRCPGSYFGDGCKPIPHQWTCPRCYEYIFVDDNYYLYCFCFISKKGALRFCCSDPKHDGSTRTIDKKYCKKSIKDFVKHQAEKAPYCALFWTNGDKYIGDLDDKKTDGYGKYLWQGGILYEGKFTQNQLNGYGKLTFSSNGNSYEGYFEKNKFNGKGKISYANGDWYEGEFSEGRPTYGTYFWNATGSVYTGHFKDDRTKKYICVPKDESQKKFHGDASGKCFWSSSKISYVGEFKDDKPSGKGKFTYADGDQFDGIFVDGRVQGEGKYHDSYGNQYKGNFIGCKLNGKAELIFANEDKYEGYMVNNKFNGEGVFQFADGDRYEGQFVEGMKEGKGKYYFANGLQAEGQFVQDRLKEEEDLDLPIEIQDPRDFWLGASHEKNYYLPQEMIKRRADDSNPFAVILRRNESRLG